MVLEGLLLADLPQAAKAVLNFAEDKKIFAFYGEMGVGKTTFIKEICNQLGVEDEVNSPTFSIVNEYSNKENEVFYHFDFYRIEKEIEAMDIGVDEYFYSSNYCFIEWPEKIENLLPESYVQVAIKEVQQQRTITTQII